MSDIKQARPPRLVFVVGGDIYPFTHTTRRQKYADPRYARYHAAKTDIGLQVTQQMAAAGWTKFPRVPLRLAIILNVSGGLHKRDLSNQLKTVEDAIQHIVLDNDAWIDEQYTYRAQAETDKLLIVIGPAILESERWVMRVRQVAEDKGLTLGTI